MKKFIALFTIAVICSSVGKAQYVNIPDSNFRYYLKSWYPACFNTAGQMDTTCSEIVNTESLGFDSYYNSNVKNFEGLQYFKRLKSFDCRNIDANDTFPRFPDSLVTLICQSMYGTPVLPPLPASLKFFDCSYSYNLDSLPLLPPGLKHLDCTNCWYLSKLPINLPPALRYLNINGSGQFHSSTPLVLPALPASLDTLSCQETSLTSLPAIPNGITYINCSRSPITSLPALPNSITYLDCSYFKWNNWNPEDTTTIDLPALPSSLKYLSCHSSGFRAMQPLPAGLEKLICNGVPVSSSISFPSTLTWLEINNCAMRSYPVLPSRLSYLDCSYNPFYNITSFPDSLTFLACNRDSLSSLPALPTGLIGMSCSDNMLTNLPSLPIGLQSLSCVSNRLVLLPALPSTLTSLGCQSNRLASLPTLPDMLGDLDCSSNQLISLPPLNRGLWNLNCSNNQLTDLPAITSDNITYIYCQGNNIYCLPKLPLKTPGNWLFVEIDDKIKCLPNTSPNIFITAYDSMGMLISQLPLCNPTNNISHCQAFPVLQGNVFVDNNNNGVKDANEPVKANARINLTNSSYTFSGNSGKYEIAADSTGNYTLSALPRRYYRYAPATYNFNFINYDTLVTERNFALQIDSIVDELTIRVTPINWAARPGFAFPYLISYENTGTTTISPDIVFDYDQLRLSYNTSSVAGVVDNNNVLSYNTGSLSPGESGSFTGFFTLKTTVPLGDTINAKATITANAFNAADSVQTIVGGAFDPNDKQATPQLSPSQVAAGKYIDYTIRFQNTGTDTAFNIVISDTLNENLQANTLQMLVSSHTCKATVKDNIVFFEFLHILLPDSNVNELKSHGFVSFRIQPQTTIIPNTIIPNKAAIYFDYNAPVITNTAGTLIKDFTVVPLKLVSLSAVPQTDNTSSLYWNTANEINTNNFVIEQGSDGSRFSAVTSVAAKGKASNAYHAVVTDAKQSLVFYRLKIVDNDGSFSYSPIIKIDRRKNAAGFSVLTNPVKDLIILHCTNNSLNHTQVSLINSNGIVVRSFLMQPGNQYIDVKGLPTGIYYLRTETGSSRILVQ